MRITFFGPRRKRRLKNGMRTSTVQPWSSMRAALSQMPSHSRSKICPSLNTWESIWAPPGLVENQKPSRPESLESMAQANCSPLVVSNESRLSAEARTFSGWESYSRRRTRS